MRATIIALLFVLSLGAADRFEVAAIHPDDPNSTGATMKFLPGGGLSISGMTIRNLIWLAWGLAPDAVTGGPKWLDSDKYSIEAKTGSARASTMAAEQPRMRTLLLERFELKSHSEKKIVAAYELNIAPRGLKMERETGPNPEKGSVLPWSLFLGTLPQHVGRPIVDRTGLSGVWYVKLHYTADDGTPRGIGVGQHPTEGGPSIFTAMEEQLGLKLVPAKAPVDRLVIDSISRPTPN